MKRPEQGPAADAALEIYELARELRDRLFQTHFEVDKQVKDEKLQMSDLVDWGLVNRMMADLFDELRKECGARRDTAGGVLAKHVMDKVLADPTLELRELGHLGVALPDAKVRPLLPKKETPEYEALCDELGISGLARERGIASISWKRLGDYMTEQLEAGTPVSEGLVRSVSIPQCTFKRHRKS